MLNLRDVAHFITHGVWGMGSNPAAQGDVATGIAQCAHRLNDAAAVAQVILDGLFLLGKVKAMFAARSVFGLDLAREPMLSDPRSQSSPIRVAERSYGLSFRAQLKISLNRLIDLFFIVHRWTFRS